VITADNQKSGPGWLGRAAGRGRPADDPADDPAGGTGSAAQRRVAGAPGSGHGSDTSAPWPNAGRGRGTEKPAAVSCDHSACQANPPRQTTTRRSGALSASSAASHGAQASRSDGSGLFAGGAQRTAAATPGADEALAVVGAL